MKTANRTPRSGRLWLAGLLACLATMAAWPCAARAQGGSEKVKPSAGAAQEAFVTDEQVSAAIGRGLKFLLDRQKSDGQWVTPYAKQFQGGAEALAVLTALSAGEKPDSAKLKQALDYLGSIDPSTVYARSLRAMVYSRLDSHYADKLVEDVKFLVDHQKSGGWGYGVGHETTEFMPEWTDASNTQMALLALRDAAEVGVQVPPSVWRKCRTYWAASQHKDGGWGYQSAGEGAGLRTRSYPSMTAAGAASLQIVADRIAPMDASEEKPRQPLALEDQGAIDKAIHCLAENYQPGQAPAWPVGMSLEWNNYYYFCLARAALAAGERTLGGQKWFVQVPATLLARQRPDGSWQTSDQSPQGQDVITTCFAILCLAQCQPMVLINKLAMSDKDSFDAQNLTRWMSRVMHHPVAWQLLTASSLTSAIDEAPILYISGRGEGEFPSAMDGPIRRLIETGGVVLVQPIAGDEKFLRQAQAYFTRLLPDLKISAFDKQHPVFGLHKELSTLPDVLCLGDTARTGVFFLKGDFSGAWHLNRLEESPWAFDFAANVVAYATDANPWPTRLSSRSGGAPAGGPGTAIAKIRVARVKYEGDWNVSPRAMNRLNDALTAALSIGVEQAAPVDLAQAVPEGIDLLWLTGTAAPAIDAKQMENLKKYLDAGGTIFIDAAKGDEAFTQAATQLLTTTFGADSLKSLSPSHAMLTGEFLAGMGANVTAVEFTPALAKDHETDHSPQLSAVRLGERPAVIFTGMGVTCPLEGLSTIGCRGLATPDARRLACNVLLYAVKEKH
jgi:hypothetical protein